MGRKSIGEDYRTQFTAAAWDPSDPDRINFTGAIENEVGIEPGDDILTPGGVDTGQNYPSLAGRRVYIRRLKDSRTTGGALQLGAEQHHHSSSAASA